MTYYFSFDHCQLLSAHTSFRYSLTAHRWSANPDNIEKYIKNGRKMKDVLGLNLQRSAKQIPESEFDDVEWPYNQTMTTDSESDVDY